MEGFPLECFTVGGAVLVGGDCGEGAEGIGEPIVEFNGAVGGEGLAVLVEGAEEDNNCKGEECAFPAGAEAFGVA